MTAFTFHVTSPRASRKGAGRRLPVWVGFVSGTRTDQRGPSGLYVRIGSRLHGFGLQRRQYALWTALAWALFAVGFALGAWVL